jgi:hypothetical protein
LLYVSMTAPMEDSPAVVFFSEVTVTYMEPQAPAAVTTWVSSIRSLHSLLVFRSD